MELSNVCKHSQPLKGKEASLVFAKYFGEKKNLHVLETSRKIFFFCMKGKTAKRRYLGALIISLCYKSEAYLRQNRFAGPEIKKKKIFKL